MYHVYLLSRYWSFGSPYKPGFRCRVTLEEAQQQVADLLLPARRLVHVIFFLEIVDREEHAVAARLVAVGPQIRRPTEPRRPTSPLAGSKFSAGSPRNWRSMSHLTAKPDS